MPNGLVWSPKEDEILYTLVEQHGTKKWTYIASQIRTKTGKQCRRRWKNHFEMQNKKNESWSKQEDAQLLEWHAELGNKWTEISRRFGDRTDNAVKNRFHALQRKTGKGVLSSRPRKRTRYSESEEEDDDNELQYEGEEEEEEEEEREIVKRSRRARRVPVKKPFEQPTPFDEPDCHPIVSSAPPSIPIFPGREALAAVDQALAERVNKLSGPFYINLSGSGSIRMPTSEELNALQIPELRPSGQLSSGLFDALANSGSSLGLTNYMNNNTTVPSSSDSFEDILNWLNGSFSFPDTQKGSYRKNSRKQELNGREVKQGLNESHKQLLARLITRVHSNEGEEKKAGPPAFEHPWAADFLRSRSNRSMDGTNTDPMRSTRSSSRSARSSGKMSDWEAAAAAAIAAVEGDKKASSPVAATADPLVAAFANRDPARAYSPGMLQRRGIPTDRAPSWFFPFQSEEENHAIPATAPCTSYEFDVLLSALQASQSGRKG